MTTTYISPADTAKLVRKALKGSFPGHRFSVRTSTYAGGASINVSWIDGPLDSAVEAVVKPFAGATFDGMIDLKSYHKSTLEDGSVVRFGADFVFTDRNMSPDTAEACKGAVAAAAGVEYDQGIRVAVTIFEGRALPCSGADDDMCMLARRLFSATEYAASKEKLERSYF